MARRSESIKKVEPKVFKGRVYRVVGRGLPPLSLEGSLAYGGRYNPPYQFGVLYCGLTKKVCWSEIEKRLEGSVNQARFKVTVLSVRLNKVLDLTDEGVLSELKIDKKSLIDPVDYGLTRQIAIAARKAGIDAILAPASTGQGNMLAIFSDQLNPQSRIAISERRK